VSAGSEAAELIAVSPPTMPKEEPAPSEYTIDELAAQSRVPSRTIRFYQSAGALQKPEIRGRVAYYTDAHLERLKLVADLQDRGLTMKAIGDLLGKVDKGDVDLGEWLGFEAQLGASWANESPKLLADAELIELIGGKRPGAVAELLRLELVERKGEAFLVKSPGLLQVAIKLEGAGIDLETAVGSLEILRRHANRAARDLVDYFYKHALRGFGRDLEGDALTEAFGALRPMSLEALRLIFGQEMQSELRALVDSGKATAIPKRKKRK
jgi:DNA-binding transcriptional MerR regulator